MNYEDLAGYEIKPGFLIVYAATLGRSPVLKYGIVTRLEQTKPDNYGNRPQSPTIRAITVDRSWGKKWELQKKGREVALSFLDRLLVVDSIPEQAKEILHEQYKKYKET